MAKLNPPILSHADSSHGMRQALYGAFSCISLALAYVADRLQPQHRAAAFGYVMASLSIGVLVGPLLGGALDPVRAARADGGASKPPSGPLQMRPTTGFAWRARGAALPCPHMRGRQTPRRA